MRRLCLNCCCLPVLLQQSLHPSKICCADVAVLTWHQAGRMRQISCGANHDPLASCCFLHVAAAGAPAATDRTAAEPPSAGSSTRQQTPWSGTPAWNRAVGALGSVVAPQLSGPIFLETHARTHARPPVHTHTHTCVLLILYYLLCLAIEILNRSSCRLQSNIDNRDDLRCKEPGYGDFPVTEGYLHRQTHFQVKNHTG